MFMTRCLYVIVIARLTFLEIRRERIVAVLASLAVLAMGITYLFSLLALGEARRIIIDFGLGLSTLLGIPLIIFVTTNLRHREEQGGGIDLILARPLDRGAFILGKFSGIGTVLFLWVMLMGALIALCLIVAGEPLSAGLVWAVPVLWMKLLILSAVGLLLGTLSSPILGGFLTLAVALVGHTVGDLEGLLPLMSEAWQAEIVRGFLLVLPRMDLYGGALSLALGQPMEGDFLLWSISYAALYITATLLVATLRAERAEIHAWR
jgi:ABC-type transport system involved in multi-copper enzyme maturation permease subunit